MPSEQFGRKNAEIHKRRPALP